MDAIPPSYEHAISKDALVIIADYIHSADLYSAALVSRRWHAIVNPHIWGSPASHFGTQDYTVYVALTRFRRTLKHARLEVRNLTHTLHLPPAFSEIYDNPSSEWLRNLLDYLPRLQSLRVSKLPFFDHNSTTSLKIPSGPSLAQDFPSYNLRLLLADGEPNTTSVGLATALSCFPALVYLDMSYTSPARDKLVLSALSALSDLQVLKMRGIGLRDADAVVLVNAIGTRVRLLDIRNNMLTDTAISSLLQACFLPEEVAQYQANTPGFSEDRVFQDYASALLRDPDLDKRFFESLTHPLTGRSIFENLAHSGITHLYISDNLLTVEGVAALLASKRLRLLDAGSVDTARKLKPDQSSLLSSSGSTYDSNTVPGAEKLVPILAAYAKYDLTYFRINYTAVTKDAPATIEKPIIELLPELPVDELDIQHSYAELGTLHEIHQLPAGNDIHFELENTSVPCLSEGQVTERDKYLDDTVDEKGSEQITHIDVKTASNFRTKKILDLLAKRPKTQILPPHRGVSTTIPYIHPSHLPHVRTLILTDVPSHVQANSPILSSLIRFIAACSDETQLAKLQARADYSFPPPGRDRTKAEQQHAKSLFALECLVLEITPVTRRTTTSKTLGAWKPQRYDEHTSWKSTTGDTDSERLWASAMDDFSFFGGNANEEECGVPDSCKEIAATSSAPRKRLHQASGQLDCRESRPPDQAEVDLVSALATFRRTKKNEFEELQRANRNRQQVSTTTSKGSISSSSFPPVDSLPLHIEGHWPGEIKVIRN